MGRPPRRRRKRRTYRWEGAVEEILGDSFWAQLIPADHTGPELMAEFLLKYLPHARPGVLFNLYTHRRGKRFRFVIRGRQVRKAERRLWVTPDPVPIMWDTFVE